MENALLMLFGILFVVWIVVGLDWWGRRKERQTRDAQPEAQRRPSRQTLLKPNFTPNCMMRGSPAMRRDRPNVPAS